MYQYTPTERQQLEFRAEQFEQQIDRFQRGEIHPDVFRQLRLRNGLYEERHAPMLRIAIPYGELGSNQLRVLAEIADRFDKGFGHFTTRQNIQFNWPRLATVPEILKRLANVDMHAIQTSGSCIRNISTDHLAGVAQDEIEDPRPWCELIRQWSTLHPEFNWLPRKFKFAVTGAKEDRALIRLHDIGIQIRHDESGNPLFRIFVGGGMGRTPVIGKEIRNDIKPDQLLPYLQAILRIYNLHGRRDHKYKSRIKILVNDLGLEQFKDKVEKEFHSINRIPFTDALLHLEKFKASFAPKSTRRKAAKPREIAVHHPDYALWIKNNVLPHINPGLRNVMVSLKNVDAAPGDISSEQMRKVAELADCFSHGEIRIHHEQNLLLPSVPEDLLYDLWQGLKSINLGRTNIGEITDMVCCPGMDYCSLANADTIPLAKELNANLASLSSQHDTGEIKLKISGCMNACGHHHVGDIGVLGVDKKGEHWYQITLGGRGGNETHLGKRLGPAVHRNDIIRVLGLLLETFRQQRVETETFAQTVQRIGIEPFQTRVYVTERANKRAA